MQIALFVNDSYFAYLLANQVVRKNSKSIAAVVFSSKTTGSLEAMGKVFRSTSLSYFAYRSFVHVLTMLLGGITKQSVRAMARAWRLNVYETSDINRDFSSLIANGRLDLAIGFNFDQIVRKDLISRCGAGIVNTHAARLPEDKGISPVLWAFGRGDTVIWSTIYMMDEGIDSGPIIEQFAINVIPGDSLFRTYARVCERSGVRLAAIVSKCLAGEELRTVPQATLPGVYHSWPDAQLDRLQRKNERAYLRMVDILNVIRKRHWS